MAGWCEMTVQTLRPTSTVATNGTPTGAVSVAAALLDDDDASYATFAGQFAEMTMDDFALPAGALITRTIIRLRTSKVGNNVVADGMFTIPGGDELSRLSALVTWLSAFTHSGDVRYVERTETEIDAAHLYVIGTGFVPSPGSLRVYEAYVDVYYVEVPVIVADGLTGVITDDDTPTVEWSVTLDSEGGAQTFYEVKVFDDATYSGGGFDPGTSEPAASSGELSGPGTSWTIDTALIDGDYKPYVRVAQTFNGAVQWSDWQEGSLFVIVLDRPAEPSVLVTAEPTRARIRLDITDEPGGTVDTDRFQVQRSDDDGETFIDVRTVDGDGMVANDGGSAIVWDLEVPNGVVVTYRVRAVHDFETGSSSRSGWTEAQGSWESRQQWLKHPTDTSLNTPVMFQSQPGHRRPARQGEFQPLSSNDVTVISDTRSPARGELTLIVEETYLERFEALLASGVPILIQTPPDQKWFYTWVSFGDLDATRYADKAWIEEGLNAAPWVQQTRPPGNLIAWPDPDTSEPDESDLILL